MSRRPSRLRPPTSTISPWRYSSSLLANLADPDREAVPAGQPHRDQALGAEGEPGALPGRLGVGDQRGRLAALERLLQPAADLVALGVLRTRATRARSEVHPGRDHAGRVVRHLAVALGRPVPGVDLPGAGQVGDVDEAVGVVGARRAGSARGRGNAASSEARS